MAGFYKNKGGASVRSNIPLNTTVYNDSMVDNGDSGTADTLDFTIGNLQKSTLTGNVTYTFVDPLGPTVMTLVVVQDSTGGYSITWPSSVIWPANTVVAPSSASNSLTLYSFVYDGTNYIANASTGYTP